MQSHCHIWRLGKKSSSGVYSVHSVQLNVNIALALITYSHGAGILRDKSGLEGPGKLRVSCQGRASFDET